MLDDLPLETERLVLRELTLDDRSRFHELANNEQVLRFLPDPPLTMEGVIRVLNFHIESYERNTPERLVKLCLGVVEKASKSNAIIGWCGLGPLDFQPDSIELFYALHPNRWGRAFATEAATAVTKFAFTKLELSRLSAVVKPENRASVRVIEKLGFRLVGEVGSLSPEFSFYEDEYRYMLDRSAWVNRNVNGTSGFRS